MTQPVSDSNSKKAGKRSPRLSLDETRLNYQGIYTCPVCHYGQIAELTLMDAFACNFCRHIFTANLAEQSVQVVDSSQPMSWRWTGHNWQVAYRDDLNLTAVIWLIGTVMVVLPAGIVWLAAHTFPPLPGSPWSWFPTVWVICTFLIHLFLVTWLMVEHYQLPFYVASKVWLQTLLDSRWQRNEA